VDKRKVISIGEAIHRQWEQKLKGQPVQPREMTDAEKVAHRLRVEKKQREAGDFGIPKTRTDTFDYSDDENDFTTIDEDMTADVASEAFLCPSVDDQLSRPGSSLTGFSIMEELVQDRLAGKVKPFREGEAIGRIQNHKRGPAPMLRTPAELYAERQRELNALREKNDATIARILGR